MKRTGLDKNKQFKTGIPLAQSQAANWQHSWSSYPPDEL